MAAAGAGPVLIAVGLIVLAAFLANQAFKRFHFPEALLLIGFGVLAGPGFAHWGFPHVDIHFFQQISPLVGTVAIIMILFDGGLEIRVEELKTGVAAGSGLAVLVFTATALLCAGIGHWLLDLEPMLALLLGIAFGGAGAVIVIPLIREMGVRPESITVVSLEAAVSDVLVIVGIYGLAEAIHLQESDPASFGRALFFTFAAGVLAGAAAGWLWSRVLGRPVLHGYGYVLTLGVLFLLYVACEHIDASGPIAVLAFGLVIGNSRRTRTFAAEEGGRVRRRAVQEPVFGENLAGFHHEAVFLVRSFFFVGLGVVLDLAAFREPVFLAVGVLMAAAVALGRWWGVRLVFLRSRLPAWDRHAISLMFPLGLAAAALSQVPSQQFHIAGTERFASLAAIVIVLTNLLAAILVFWSLRPANRKRFERGPPMPAVRTAKPPKPAGR